MRKEFLSVNEDIDLFFLWGRVSQPHFEGIVRSPLTLLKMGLGSCRNPSFGLATKAKGVARLRAKRKEARESRQRHCKSAGQGEARELRQEEARESHHILPGVLESEGV